MLAAAVGHTHHRLPEVRQFLTEAEEWCRQTRYTILLAQVLLLQADLEHSEQSYLRALERAAEARSTGGSAGALQFSLSMSAALEARALLGLGRPDAALIPARGAVALRPSTRTPAFPRLEHLPRLALAEVLTALGQHAEAREILVELAGWLDGFLQAIPDPAWRTERLRVPDYARIRSLAAEHGAGGPLS